MSKYAPLAEYLKKQNREFVPMTFTQIEKVTGTQLPPSATKHRPWWSNNPKNSVLTKIWLDAGFESEQVDMAGRKLVFRRVRNVSHFAIPNTRESIHPAFGALKGLLQIIEGTDLTKPADPAWANRLDAEQGEEKN